MSQVDENDILNQLDEIQLSLQESEKFIPYNYDLIIMWGVISTILFIFSEIFFVQGIVVGGLFLSCVLGLGFAIEYFFIKKENKKYKLAKFTNLQSFINTLFAFSMIFGVIFTVVLVKITAIIYIPLLWMFIIGFANFSVGYVINGGAFKIFGIVVVGSSLILFAVSIFKGVSDVDCFTNNTAAILTLGLGHVLLGLKLKYGCKKDSNSV